MTFQPDFHFMLDVMANRRPARLPIYEHIISPTIMEKILGVSFAQLEQGNDRDLDEFFTNYCRFWPLMTYDTVSFEVCITEIGPIWTGIHGTSCRNASGRWQTGSMLHLDAISRKA
jgi:uroporphyrinogen decarboxylase